jgi:hypothetical protein
LSPRSFARLIGEPLNEPLNSGWVTPRISLASVRASLPASTSRAEYGEYGECSDDSRANRTFHGHTSWEISQQTRFAISLRTGKRTRPDADG